MGRETMASLYVVVLGDPKVGKSSFVGMHTDGEPSETKAYHVCYNSTVGEAHFVLVDIAEVSDYSDHAAIIMFDHKNASSIANVHTWVKSLPPGTPFIIVGNKSELGRSKVKIDFPYLDISAKTNYNFDAPLLWLFRQTKKDYAIEFTE